MENLRVMLSEKGQIAVIEAVPVGNQMNKVVATVFNSDGKEIGKVDSSNFPDEARRFFHDKDTALRLFSMQEACVLTVMVVDEMRSNPLEMFKRMTGSNRQEQ